jgi:AmmeMemoRadiSam system protein A
MQTESNDIDNGKDLPGLSDESKKYLLDVAREAVRRYVYREPRQKLEYDDPVLKGLWGAFVTLKIGDDLRGCIGNLLSDKPLPETIAEMAVKSASSDPRFAPLSQSEFTRISIDISVMGPIREVSNIDEIVIGRDGLIIEQGYRHGLLLPQVATEHNLGLHAFLSQTCLKAGLPPDAWKHGAKIQKFSAEVF